MKRIKHTIKRENIVQVNLVSLTEQAWYDYNGNIIYWSGITPTTLTNGTKVYNISGGTVDEGYYVWGTPTSNRWNSVSENQIYGDYQLPI